MNTEETRLSNIYGRWTAQLNVWTAKQLGRHIDCQFFPDKWIFRVYSGYAQEGDIYALHTVPTISRPPGERFETIPLPRPNEHPTDTRLEEVFRRICLAAARVLELDLQKPRLPEKEPTVLYGPTEMTDMETGQKIIVPHGGKPKSILKHAFFRNRRKLKGGNPPSKQPPPVAPDEP